MLDGLGAICCGWGVVWNGFGLIVDGSGGIWCDLGVVWTCI